MHAVTRSIPLVGWIAGLAAGAVLVLGPAALPASAPSPAPFGPPAICHPLDIGGALSLPWAGEGPFDVDEDYDAGRAVDDALVILRGSDDTLVHVETLRRAVVYISRDDGDGNGRGWVRTQRDRLLASLRAELDWVDGDRRAGLAHLDLGYALGALDQMGVGVGQDPAPVLDRAAELRPADGALHLGASLALGMEPRHRAVRFAHLDRALELAQDRDGLLHVNIMSTSAHFWDVRTRDELVHKIRSELERA